MPDPITPATVSTANAPDGLYAKPKRARKAKAAAPKVERAKRTTPARTLRVRIEALAGSVGLDAYDMLKKKHGPMYEEQVRGALDDHDALHKANARLLNAENEVTWAKESVADWTNAVNQSHYVLDRLILAAKTLASLDVEPDAPTADDFKGVGSV